MKAFVFTDAALREQAGRFVWLEINTEQAVNAPLRKKFPIPSLPSFFVVNPTDETVALRWVGGATAPQLVTMLQSASDRVLKGPSASAALAGTTPAGADQWLERADIAYGAGQDSVAARAYREALLAAPDGWPSYGRAVESLLFALQRIDACEDVARLSMDVFARLRHTPSAINVAGSGLDCALSLPADNPVRQEMLATLEAHAREVVADMSIPIAADDRSSLYGGLVGAREEAGDEAGKMETARQWAAFLEKEAAAAATPAQRTVFDSHRLSAYLTLNEPEKAIPMLEQSERDIPDDYNPPARLATAYKAMKRWDEALAASDRALAKAYGPRKLGMLQTRADIFLGKGDRAMARSTIEEAIRTAEAFPSGQRSESTIAALRKKLDSLN